ncbi:MAG TPA: hypothetical protein VK875_07880 [Euzebyales bacterium]|nr:hypothetical protein [Euzebyales bacterium]
MPPTAFVLVHSPICGPDTWWPVAEALSAMDNHAVVPDLGIGGRAPYWRSHTRSVVRGIADEVAPGTPIVLAAHSGAGQLLGVLGLVLHDVGFRVAAYVLADAGLPPDGESRLQQLEREAPDFAAELRQHFGAGGSFPSWTDATLEGLIPDDARRARLLAGVRQLPFEYWEEIIPSAPEWPEAPVGVLLFSGSYEATAQAARQRQWPLRRLSANNHFLPLSDENAVAEELVVLAEDLSAAPAK